MNTVNISSHGYTASINLTLGANCISLRHKESGAVILREPSYERPLDNPYLYGMPILFPQNRISGGTFEFDGRRYSFPINEEKTGCHLHGTLHTMPFKIQEQTESSVTAYFSAKIGEYLGFPHVFEIIMSYTLTDEGMIHKTEVKNLSDTAMPCLLGFHTTFNSTPFNGCESRVLVDISKEFERNMENYLPTGHCPEPDAVTSALIRGSFDPLSVSISRHYKAGGVMRLMIRSKDYAVSYENSENLPFRLIYNGDADGYICLEPLTSLANSPNSPFDRSDAGFLAIPPRSSEHFTSKIKVITNT